MRAILTILITFSFLVGWEAFVPSHYARVVNVGLKDVLNIRKAPNSNSQKVGYIFDGELIIIEYCIKSHKNGSWCKISPVVVDNLSVNTHAKSGFVNARYLKFLK